MNNLNGIQKLFLVWGAIVLAGFTFTYLNQALGPTTINLFWAVLAGIGLLYSKKQMPWSDHTLRNIFLVWLVVIIFGLIFSHVAFISPPLFYFASLLGAVWLILMALGHALTGLIDKKKIYILTAGLPLVAALFIFLFVGSTPALYSSQYLIAGIVGATSMALLFLFA